MNIPKWLKDLFRIEDLTLEEVVPVNYSFNNYDPKNPIIIRNKEKLRKQFRRKLIQKISYKQYSAACTAMKSGWKNKSLVDVPVDDFSQEIIGSSFSQKEPHTDVFPPDLTGRTFTRCNLGNCNIPTGNTVNGGLNNHYKTQNDCEYWVVDKDLNPVEPLSPKRYDRFGLSKRPEDLPLGMMDESIIVKAEKAKQDNDRKQLIIDIANDPDKLNEIIESGEQI